MNSHQQNRNSVQHEWAIVMAFHVITGSLCELDCICLTTHVLQDILAVLQSLWELTCKSNELGSLQKWRSLCDRGWVQGVCANIDLLCKPNWLGSCEKEIRFKAIKQLGGSHIEHLYPLIPHELINQMRQQLLVYKIPVSYEMCVDSQWI